VYSFSQRVAVLRFKFSIYLNSDIAKFNFPIFVSSVTITLQVESVVKAVGLPVDFLEEVDDDLEEKQDEKDPAKPDSNIRKRRYSSEEDWGDEGSRDDYTKHSRKQDHHSRRENQSKKDDRKIGEQGPLN
jgi:hypothetical protein